MIQFSTSSNAQLATCELDLQEVAYRTADNIIPELDFSIVEGHRPVVKQQEYFKKGLTHIDGIDEKGKHNYSPSQAFDFYPWSPTYGTLTGHPTQVAEIAQKVQHKNETLDSAKARVMQFIYAKFYAIAARMKETAEEIGVDIRWGGDWDSDGDILDHSFVDLPHIELLK